MSFKKIYDSATFMTWGSFLIKTINAIIILPLILRVFPKSEVSVWLLFLLVFNLLSLIDLGFSQSFSRAISYALGGAEKITKKFITENKRTGSPNWVLIGKIVLVMRKVYLWLSILSLFFILIFGTLAVQKSISETRDQINYWIAWGVIVVTAPFCIYGILYTTYLMGINKIALIKRWDIIFGFLSVISSIAIVSLSPSILLIVINNQFWLIVLVIKNYYLVKSESKNFNIVEIELDSSLFQSIWSTSWRSAIGIIMSYGILQLTGIIFAQIETNSQSASYLLALRIMNTIVDFSRAPFYSKLPTLSSLKSQGRTEEIIRIAQDGMMITQWIFVGACVAVSFLHIPILNLIGSKTSFVDGRIWAIMSCAFFFERYGSMHLQLYTITNHIIWHKVNFISGIIILVSIWLGYKQLGILIFPLSMLISNSLWYAVVTANHSYKEFKMNFLKFETKPSIVPFLILILQFLIL